MSIVRIYIIPSTLEARKFNDAKKNTLSVPIDHSECGKGGGGCHAVGVGRLEAKKVYD